MDIDEEEDNVIDTTEVDDDLPAVDPAILAYGSVDEEREIGSSTPTPTQDLKFATQLPQETLKLNGLVPQVKSLNPAAIVADPALDSVESSEPFVERSKPTPRQAVTIQVPVSRYRALPYSTSQSGLVYDPRMRFHCELKPVTDDIHPEDPSRISEIFQELVDAGLVQDPLNIQRPGLPSELQLARINCRQATTAEIRLVHDFTHIEWVRALASRTATDLIQEERHLDSLYLHNQTYLCASLSAGGAIEATKAVVAGQVKNAVAVIRPPGHHAEHAKPGGFCFFNNVCIAAKVCQADFPDECRKILILDWDVHHGNGVQEAFYNDPNVLYISLHVYQNGTFYPGGTYGNHLHCGEGVGMGRNVNIPWTRAGMTDADYIYAFQQVVMPIAVEFSPDLVLISAGFDAAEGDELGRCHVSPAGFAHMTHMLRQLAKGKVVACLEGGYNLRSIAKSTLAVTRTLMGEPPDRLVGGMVPSSSAISDVQLVIRQQAKFWKCMYPKDVSTLRPDLQTERLHDIMRFWQSEALSKQYHMSELFILRESISKSFERQVLATNSPNFNSNRPLLIIFHDPPEVLGLPDPRTSQLELHNTWVADGSKTYIDWAIEHNFGVIDVNIPKFITGIQDANEYGPSEPGHIRSSMALELAVYLWENYIELNDASHVFFLGIGDACAGLTELLRTTDDTLDRVNCFISILSDENPLRRVVREDDDTASLRYYRNSLVFISQEHPIWELPKKIKKSHGTLVKSPHTDLMNMLLAHKDAVTGRLWAETAPWRDAGGANGNDDDDDAISTASSSAPQAQAAAPDPKQPAFVDDRGRNLVRVSVEDTSLDHPMDTEPLSVAAIPTSPPPPPEPASATLPAALPPSAVPALAPPPASVTAGLPLQPPS